jgi:NTP pyrophosphatase (non-canonical NTP hydrolase)
LDFNEYRDEAIKTAVYPEKMGLSYTTLGLVGEAGEIANKVKKVYRDHDGEVPEPVRKELEDELGDVLWYLAMMCFELGLDFDAVAIKNIEKLESRRERGVLQGSGDNR